MYHQCLKAVWKGKKVHINAYECHFQQDEPHFSEVSLFDELEKVEQLPQLKVSLFRHVVTSSS